MATAVRDWSPVDSSYFDELRFVQAWLLALVTYGVGDVVTTIAIVSVSDLHAEANPVVRQAIAAFGGGGFLGLKFVVFCACIVISLRVGAGGDDPLMLYYPPLLLAVVGSYLTLHNLGLLML